MKKVILFSLIYFANSLTVISQDTNETYPNFSFGLVAGYKSTNAAYGMCINYEVKRVIEANLGFAVQRFQGTGVSVGLRSYLFREKTWRPYLGFTYLNTSGLVYNEIKDGSFLRYMSPPQQFLVPVLGVRYNESAISILFSMNYQKNLSFREAYFVSGKKDINIKESIDRMNSGGLGFTIGFMFHWW